jgi:hypothetical protein
MFGFSPLSGTESHFRHLFLFFACPKKRNKKKGTPSGSANDLQGLR